MILGLLIKITGSKPRPIFTIKYDITRILNSKSWKEAVLTTVVVKDPSTSKKCPEYSVLIQIVIFVFKFIL